MRYPSTTFSPQTRWQMARPIREVHPGEAYHLTARGSNRQSIFLDGEDCQRFLMRLGRTSQRREWSCLGYCLMGNHIHLVVRGDHGAISDGMRDLLGGHASSFNHRHGRSGHVFGDRFHDVHVGTTHQMHAVLRYVALNPVRAGLVSHPDDWMWSSYAAMVAGVIHPGTIDLPSLNGLFGLDDGGAWIARERIIDLVRRGIPEAAAAARTRREPAAAGVSPHLGSDPGWGQSL